MKCDLIQNTVCNCVHVFLRRWKMTVASRTAHKINLFTFFHVVLLFVESACVLYLFVDVHISKLRVKKKKINNHLQGNYLTPEYYSRKVRQKSTNLNRNSNK